jgi:hypothetical protein
MMTFTSSKGVKRAVVAKILHKDISTAGVVVNSPRAIVTFYSKDNLDITSMLEPRGSLSVRVEGDGHLLANDVFNLDAHKERDELLAAARGKLQSAPETVCRAATTPSAPLGISPIHR